MNEYKRGVKPKPINEKLQHRVVTRFNDDDYKDLIELVRISDYLNISEYLRNRILDDLTKYRISKNKQMVIPD